MKFFILLLLAGASSAEVPLLEPENINPSNFVHEVIPHSHPYMVYILTQFSFGARMCGGSIIAPRSVLTAASCIAIQHGTNIGLDTHVIAGVHNFNVHEATQQRQIVNRANYIIHPDYTTTSVNDVAILRCPIPWIQTTYVQFIRLPFYHLDETFAGFKGTTLGWGGGSPVLRYSINEVLSDEVCAETWGARINGTIICTGVNEFQSGPCSGDWGAPLVLDEPQFGGVIQVGVWTFVTSVRCGQEPSGYTRLTYYSDWIVRNML